MVRSRFTLPERSFCKPDTLLVPCNPLNYRASNIRTKMAVVRLFRRKGPERDEKRPEVGLSRGPGGSDNLPGMAAFCGIPTANQEQKKNVPNGRLGGGKLTGREHSFRWGALKHYESSLPNVPSHWLRCLRLRSQRHRLTWRKMMRIAERWLPSPKLRHLYPAWRFDVMTRGGSPVR
jgi:hypothetical protein